MKRALALRALIALSFAAGRADAADVSLAMANGKVSARVAALEYPRTLVDGLTSGLANRLYVRVSLLAAGREISRRAVELTLRYDLWDEAFSFTNTTDGVLVESRKLASLDEVRTLLTSLPLPRLFDASALPPGRELVLHVELLLNPIDREKMRMIQKWVSRHTAPPISGEQGSSMSNAIFNRIFEQYSGGADLASVWRARVESAPFRVETLKHDAN